MKRILGITGSIIILVCVGYLVGPRVAPPKFEKPRITLPSDLTALEQQIIKSEKATKGIKPDTQARIVWADTTKKKKTRLAFLFLHGFTASQGDGLPIHTQIAKAFKGNLYLFRNAHHGVDLGDSTMVHAKADDFVYEAEKALAIAKLLGDEVIVMGNSLGGALTLYLASRHPEIKGIVLFAPGIRTAQAGTSLVIGPWGYQIAKLLTGSDYVDHAVPAGPFTQYWTPHSHLNGAIAGINFIYNSMREDTFKKITCPTFLGYWYKNEEVQDNQASVGAMLKMFQSLSTPASLKRKVAFPNAGDHVISSRFTSKSWEAAREETIKFLNDVVKISY